MREFPLVSNLRAGADSRSRPRLLVLASTFPAEVGDGTPAFVADLAREEAAAFDTVVLAPLVPGAQRREEQSGYQIRRYRFFPGRRADLADGAILENLRSRPSRWLQVPTFFLAGALAVRRAVRDTAPDVVHVHWIIPQGLMALLSARGVPWLVTTLGGDLYALTNRPARFLKRLVLRRAGAVTVMNEEMRQVVIGLGVAPEKVRVLPMGVALERLRPAGEPPARVPGRLVFVGRLVEKKGLEHLLDALREVPPELGCSLDVVGDGPLRAALEERARPLGDRVVFHGQQGSDALRRLLGSAELAVFPSVRARSGDQDGLPVATLEALAAGTPVIASDLPGLSDAVAGGDEPAGVLVRPGDVAGLTAAVTRLLGDDAARERLGRAAVRRAEAYSMEAIGAQYVAQLQDVAGTAGR
jgi:glycosyltransferase involved in cell wall biosynthesis